MSHETTTVTTTDPTLPHTHPFPACYRYHPCTEASDSPSKAGVKRKHAAENGANGKPATVAKTN